MQHTAYKSLLNIVFVVFQFGGVAFILVTGPMFSSNIILLSIQLTGLFIGIWAVVVMRPNNLRILPDLKKNAQFVAKGPYQLIRHPMYLGILLCTCPLILSKFSISRLLVLFLIIIDLILKLLYEERLLKRHFENYQEYMQRTYRIFPFIF